MYMQSFSLACAGKLREKEAEEGERGRREEGRKEKIDVYVNRQTHRKTYRQALEHFERLKTPPCLSLILPLPPLCHMFIAAPEEPSDWWVQPSVKSVSFKDEWWLLVLFL